MVYSQGIVKNRFYSEVKRVFNQIEDYDRFISIQSFYKEKIARVIDLRSIEDNMRHATGRVAKNFKPSSGFLRGRRFQVLSTFLKIAGILVFANIHK